MRLTYAPIVFDQNYQDQQYEKRNKANDAVDHKLKPSYSLRMGVVIATSHG